MARIRGRDPVPCAQEKGPGRAFARQEGPEANRVVGATGAPGVGGSVRERGVWLLRDRRQTVGGLSCYTVPTTGGIEKLTCAFAAGGGGAATLLRGPATMHQPSSLAAQRRAPVVVGHCPLADIFGLLGKIAASLQRLAFMRAIRARRRRPRPRRGGRSPLASLCSEQ